MKKICLFLFALIAVMGLRAQTCYWVFLADKQGTNFDPYSYFDVKAIARYQQCGADLYDITNYPLNASYVEQVDALATEEVGQSRWFNAIGVMATDEQIAAIARLPFVVRTQQIAANMQLTGFEEWEEASETMLPDMSKKEPIMHDQLTRMQGEMFRANGFTGKGIRIAVFDGGFPNVDKHAAFQHLRDNNLIKATWNFCNKKANVYGWNSHGTNTLSCITGILDGEQFGLATEAEFLLARTEVGLEPFKEEVWWMQAVEWADKNGADIISSSLGYGKERHYTTDMDGTSYVAKAGNLAARKGILVCNSAGNEGDDKQWKTIITPSDADSVICVGGIEKSLTEYHHINFSSYGPSADGRLKPNVCAFGYAIAAKHSDLNGYNWVYGTSFSCPLVAGFAACAWQASPGKTAMEMTAEIEKSGDLYPYFDYAFGYGVPQASYFVNKGKTAVEPTFTIEDHDSCIWVKPTQTIRRGTLMFNAQKKNGQLEQYFSFDLKDFDPSVKFIFDKERLCYRTLNVWLNGYTSSYTLPESESRKMEENGTFYSFGFDVEGDSTNTDWDYDKQLSRTLKDNEPIKWGSNNKYRAEWYLTIGDMIGLGNDNGYGKVLPWSPSVRIGLRAMKAFGKAYCLGLGVEYGNESFRMDKEQLNGLDKLFGLDAKASDKYYDFGEWSLELFQRVRFVPGGISSKGIFWDLGVYGSHGNYNYVVLYDKPNYAESQQTEYANPKYIDNYRWNWGFVTRIAYDVIGIYARYRMTGWATCYDIDPTSPTAFQMDLPRLEVGLTINF